MIPFKVANPFPHLPVGTYTYASAKVHAKAVDQWLGFDIDGIERNLALQKSPQTSFPQERWIGLDAQSFLTPYVEIRSILELLNLQSGDLVVDLGCGYGRMGHVLGRHFPQVSFLGYELVPERVQEARKSLQNLNYSNVRIEEMDLSLSLPEVSPFYFIYDYGSKAAIEKTLSDLQKIARHDPIQVIARGRASRFFIQQNNPWLSEVNEPRHFETFSIYKS